MIVIFYTNQSVDFFNRQSLTFLFAKNNWVSLRKMARPDTRFHTAYQEICTIGYLCGKWQERSRIGRIERGLNLRWAWIWGMMDGTSGCLQCGFGRFGGTANSRMFF
jgi:hypothetical protein